MEAVVGVGWLHGYVNGTGDDNSWGTRLGVNFNFNIGKEKAWAISLKPSLVYDMKVTLIGTRVVSMPIMHVLNCSQGLLII